MKKPCAECPFVRGNVFEDILGVERVQEILTNITQCDQTFTCHKTLDPTTTEQHCAGALILLEKIGQPNQMMRIAERLRVYDRTTLRAIDTVYDTPEEMLASRKRQKKRRKRLKACQDA